jgi:hypothetical protein
MRTLSHRGPISDRGEEGEEMHRQKLALLIIILLGGTAVMVSYIYPIATQPQYVEPAWGGITPDIRRFYAPSMLLAASGFFFFTYFLLFRVDPDQASVAGRFGFWVFNVLYAAILVGSALYMPLTFAFVARPSMPLWWVIRLVLAVVGLASLGLLASLLALQPRQPAWSYWLAVAGTIPFSFQTAVLDMLVWPTLYPL